MYSNFVYWCLLFFFLLIKVKNIEYYVDFSHGNDNNLGDSIPNAWKHCPGDPNSQGIPSTISLNPGDIINFKKGVKYYGTIEINADGITYKGDNDNYGSGDNAIIDGSVVIPGVWQRCTSACSHPDYNDVWWIDVSGVGYESIFQPIFKNDQMIWFAQDPNPIDPFFWNHRDTMRTIPLVDPTGKTSITNTEMKDEDYFVSGDPNYYSETYIAVWREPNVVTVEKIISYNPSTHTITFGFIDRIYDDRDTKYMIINHLNAVDNTYEYYYDDSQKKLYVYMENGDNPNVHDYEIANREYGIRIHQHDDIVIEGFIIQKFWGGYSKTRGGIGILQTTQSTNAQNLIIRNNVIRNLRSMEARFGVELTSVVGALVQNNEVSNCQRNGGFLSGGENIIYEYNTVRKIGRTAFNLMNTVDNIVRYNHVEEVFDDHGNSFTVYLANVNTKVYRNSVWNSCRPLTYHGNKDPDMFINNLEFYDNLFVTLVCKGSQSWGGYARTVVHHHNTYYGPGVPPDGGLVLGSKEYDVSVHHNIIEGLGGWETVEDSEISRPIDHNLYTALSYKQADRYGWSLREGEYVIDESHLININVGNFRLKYTGDNLNY